VTVNVYRPSAESRLAIAASFSNSPW